jgi:hypothetical protein
VRTLIASGPSLDPVAGWTLRANVGRPIRSLEVAHRAVDDDANDAFPGERSGDDVAEQRGVRPAAAVDGYHVPGLGQVGHLEQARMSPGLVHP